MEGKLKAKAEEKVVVTLFQRWFEFKITLLGVGGMGSHVGLHTGCNFFGGLTPNDWAATEGCPYDGGRVDNFGGASPLLYWVNNHRDCDLRRWIKVIVTLF